MKRSLFATTLFLLLFACAEEPPPVTLLRFDQDLMALDTTQVEASMKELARKYPDFLPFFLTEIAHDPTRSNETPREALIGFAFSPQIRRLYDSCRAAFPDLYEEERALARLAQRYQQLFPRRSPLRFVVAITEFVGDAYAVNDSLVMIGLDMFLGENFSGYDPQYFPHYLRRQFRREYLPVKVGLAVASRLVGPPPQERILDYMINNGKILYVLDQLLPDEPEYRKMGYTEEQLAGCYANEAEVWARLLELKVLYEPVSVRNQKLVMPSPATEMVFREAPGEIGNWVGWQIVKAYMRRNPKTSLEELINFRDSQRLLELSRYKPKRTD
ncbi:MAG: hypothetical protein NZM43_07590 [Saprospiraceae bacterium]|nr:hypothetical protein [Saprospiraceae bacterium]MDW8484168.1 hypothetical protein [Saprospiraceae bacterium]